MSTHNSNGVDAEYLALRGRYEGLQMYNCGTQSGDFLGA